MPTPVPTSSRYFPSHPNLIRTTVISADPLTPGGQYKIEHTPFTGDEAEPARPPLEDKLAAIKQHPEDEEAIQAEYDQRWAEAEALYPLWRRAYYLTRVTPLINAAFAARPVVDAALRELDEAWAGLDTAAVWPVAVKRVLDAQSAAIKAMEHWIYTYAKPLSEVESDNDDMLADWQAVARQLGYDPQFDIGWTYSGNYDASPMTDLDRKITGQRRRMTEIAQYSKQDDQ